MSFRPFCVLAIGALLLRPLACLAAMPAQQPPPNSPEKAAEEAKSEKPAEDKPQEKPDAEKERAAAERKAALLQRLRFYAERALGFEDLAARVRGAARLAAALCKHEPDYAREVFLRAHFALIAAEEAHRKAAASAKDGPPPRTELPGVRSFLMWRVAQCDAGLAQSLTEQDTLAQRPASDPSPRATASLRSAFALLKEDPGKAAEQAAQAARYGLSGYNVERFAMLLNQLRMRNPAAANAAFLEAVGSLRSRIQADAGEVLHLGAYLFTAPRMGGYPRAAPLQVGGLRMANLSVARPEATAPFVREYLDTAVDVLTRPVFDTLQKQYGYTAAQQLLPKVREFAPGRAAELEAVLQELGAGMPPALSQAAAALGRYDTTLDTDSSEAERRIERIADVDRRDEAFLGLAAALIYGGNLARARDISVKIHDLGLQKAVNTQIDFADGTQALNRKESDAALQMAVRLPVGLEAALLMLGIARERVKTDRDAASADLFTALGMLEAIEPHQRPFLVLAAAGVQAQIDTRSTLQTLAQAIDGFNEQFPPPASGTAPGTGVAPGSPRPPPGTSKEQANQKEKPGPPTHSGHFRAQIQWKDTERQFLLQVKGVPAFDFAPALDPLAAAHPEDTEGTVMNLRNEELLGQALAALAHALLLPPTRPTRKQIALLAPPVGGFLLLALRRARK